MDTATRDIKIAELAAKKPLIAERNAALAAGDIARFQAITLQIALMPMTGVRPLTQRDIDKYVGKKWR